MSAIKWHIVFIFAALRDRLRHIIPGYVHLVLGFHVGIVSMPVALLPRPELGGRFQDTSGSTVQKGLQFLDATMPTPHC